MSGTPEQGRSEGRIEQALVALSPYEARTAAAIFERLFPADESGPNAVEIGVVAYLDRVLAGVYHDKADTYRLGLAALDRVHVSITALPSPSAIRSSGTP